MSQGKEQTVLGESALSRYSDLSLKAYSQSVSVPSEPSMLRSQEFATVQNSDDESNAGQLLALRVKSWAAIAGPGVNARV